MLNRYRKIDSLNEQQTRSHTKVFFDGWILLPTTNVRSLGLGTPYGRPFAILMYQQLLKDFMSLRRPPRWCLLVLAAFVFVVVVLRLLGSPLHVAHLVVVLLLRLGLSSFSTRGMHRSYYYYYYYYIIIIIIC
mmetsp:Transcript_21894/g.37240  ORF Transcript_21894/g.37240 Transcript_21894/m.37240 type:complete len:133 (-) Transcript_21894:6-404(-)